jgi:hypothetical protein
VSDDMTPTEVVERALREPPSRGGGKPVPYDAEARFIVGMLRAEGYQLIRLNPDDLTDEQVDIYEAGYIAGQSAVAKRLRVLARQLDLSEAGSLPQGDE